ncbi:MAG: thiol reductase thioredoxin [Rhodospirillaceae bacterium]|nr:thiol reductase thioredoxin [Rhodospirillaceae bacterium]
MADSSSLHVVCPHCDRTNRVPVEKLSAGGRCGACHEPLFESRPLALTEARFAKHAAGDIPLLIDFWASWCGPCRMMAPVFEEAAKELEPQVRLVKVDTDAEQGLAARFRIQSIPSLILVHRGKEIARTTGAMPKTALLDWTRRALPARAAA